MVVGAFSLTSVVVGWMEDLGQGVVRRKGGC